MSNGAGFIPVVLLAISLIVDRLGTIVALDGCRQLTLDGSGTGSRRAVAARTGLAENQKGWAETPIVIVRR